MPIEFIAFKKLHVTDYWKKANESDDNLFTTFILDGGKGYLTYTDLDDKKLTLKFVSYAVIQISGNCLAFKKQSFEID